MDLLHDSPLFALICYRLCIFNYKYCYVWTSFHYADTLDCLVTFSFSLTLKPMYDTIWWSRFVQYNLVDSLCTIRSSSSFWFLLYNINLWATHTTIPSTRGVKIRISLVSSTTDSIQRCVVVFKTCTVFNSDPKSEFLWQSSSIVHNLWTPPEPPRTPGISPTPLSTMYHPYCHSPSALTEYLKQKLHSQWAKRLGHSLPAQVEPNVHLERNKYHVVAVVRP